MLYFLEVCLSREVTNLLLLGVSWDERTEGIINGFLILACIEMCDSR